MNDELTDKWKRKKAELDEKASELKTELEAKKAAKAISPLADTSLDDDISRLKDLIEFYSKEAKKYSSKLRKPEIQGPKAACSVCNPVYCFGPYNNKPVFVQAVCYRLCGLKPGNGL
ncbi:hypothetical protein HYX05_03115 [Candidatus Woesearchaeota archaeon]|nr:hypothetical protein [Candidatus Woesearchaeota archaeon]